MSVKWGNVAVAALLFASIIVLLNHGNGIGAFLGTMRYVGSGYSREQEVMAYIVSGLMNKQIAGLLRLSEITVKVHRASIMRKMNAKSLAELVRQADALDLARPALKA